jgi:phage-related protein
MSQSNQEETIQISQEEIKQLSKIMAETLLQQLPQTPQAELTVVTCISGYEIIKEDQITQVINLDLLASSTHGITDILGQISGWFSSIINSIAKWIVGALEAFISGVASAITGAISTLGASVSSFISTAVSTIGGYISGAVTTISSTVSGFISSAVSTISSTISGIISAVSTALSSAVSTISSAISGIISTIQSILSGIASTITSAISGAISTITSAISGVISTITSALSGIASTIMGAISGAVSALSTTISGIISAITSAFSGLASTITSMFNTFASAITGAISSAITAISNAISSIGSAIMNALKGFIDTIGKAISGIAETITSALSSFGKTILESLTGFIKTLQEVFSGIAKGIMEGIAGIGKGIIDLWNFLVGAFQDIATKVGAGFKVIGNTLMGFINSIIQAGQWIVNAIAKIGDMIWKALPDWLRSGLEAIGNFFKSIVDAVVAFFKDPLGWLNTWIVQPLLGALDWLWNALKTVWNWITSAISGFVKWLWDGVLSLAQGLVSLMSEAFEGLITFGEKLTEGIRAVLINPILTMFKSVFTGLADFIEGMIKRITTGTSKGEMAEALELFGLIVSTQFTFRMVSQALLWAGEATSDWKIMPNVAIKILGAGGETTLEIPLKFGNIIKHLAHEFRRYPDELMRGFFIGISLWITQPIVRLIKSIFRNKIPIELPTVEVLVEATRRTMPHEKFPEMIEKARYFMGLYGYSDYVIDLYFKTAKEFNITVTDRFGTKRTIPLSLMYQLPSSSDVATMMVRDIFATIEDFQKLYLATGMEKDVGVLYYFLRFRYPPPERLWQFTMRGISGLLWATLPDAERADIEKEAKPIGALMPVAPEAINFKADKLLDAFKTYMKWHDYARFSWIKDFPSDNLIYIDTLADIPMKIDQRWMVKWGIYELLSEKKVTYQSPVKEFATKILEDAPASEIKMDLTNFSRTILATGLHPDWVPVTAVAEAMNILADERTVLRTGFMGLFKEGFYDIKALDTMLTGFIKASFQVAYFDIAKMQWTTGWVNVPVMFLPPERKLIELRALMDRSLDILREIQKDISIAYQEFIIWDYNEYKAKLTAVINNINEFYTKDYEAITGTKLPEELKLKFIEEYYKPYIEALKIWREVFTVRRIRMWTMRWIGWIMYRVAYGVVEKEDIDKLVTYVKDKAKLTDYETEFIRQIVELMYGIARKSQVAEYLPTPSTMATLSEYMTLDPNLVKQVLAKREIPEEWQKIWLTYIAVRPIKADAKALLSTYVRALRYGAITRETLNKYIETLPQYGFTTKEIELITQSIALEEEIIETRENRREYIPTLSTIASMLEYVNIPSEQIKKVFEARKVPKEWQEIWSLYYAIRPIADDVRVLVSAYYRAKRYQLPLDEIEKQVLGILKASGMTDQELAIRDLATQLEIAVNEYLENKREYIPTPSMLASMSEYITIPEQLIQQVFTARRIPPEWQGIWKQYITIRPLVDDVRGLLASYRRAILYVTVPEDIKKAVENYAKMIGFTDTEWNILALRTSLEELILEARTAKAEYIPSPMTLATLCEYVPQAREFFDDIVKAKRIPPEWQELWAKYIDIRPLVDDVRRYMSRAESLYVYFMVKQEDFKKIVEEVGEYLGYTKKEKEFLMKVADMERYANAWRELIGSVERLVSLSEYSPKASKYALGKLQAMIEALPLTPPEKAELKQMWEEYIRNRPVKAEAKMYITQLINLYVDGLISEDAFVRELDEMKKWGFSDDEIMFYKAQAALRRARKLRIPVGE